MKKSIYIHIPKTAGISIQQYGIDNNININVIGHHSPAKDIINRYKDYFLFTFVRNPYDRFMSSYYFYKDAPVGTKVIRDDIQQYKTFKDFCLNFQSFKHKTDIQFYNQTHFILDNNDNLIVDFVGRFEDIASGWEEICKIGGWEHKKLPHKNKTEHLYWEDEYNDDMKEIVFNLFTNDFKYFNYKK